jgi:hypothetical protein
MDGTRFGHSLETWESAKEEARAILGARARAGTTIAYSDLVQRMRTISLQPESPALAAMLGEIAVEEDEAGRGMLPVVVVHKDGDKMPGQGFFELAKRLGRDTTDRLTCWATEMDTVQKAWSRPRRRRGSASGST